MGQKEVVNERKKNWRQEEKENKSKKTDVKMWKKQKMKNDKA